MSEDGRQAVPELPLHAGERLVREHTLRRRPDYQRCYRRGRRKHSPLATLHSIPNQLEHPRLGITATRKTGKAVVRQLLKRRVREVYRRWSRRDQLPYLDLVIHLKPAAAQASFPELRQEVLRLLEAQLDERRPRVRRRRPRAGHPSSGASS